MDRHKTLFAFDIETIPDTDVAAALCGNIDECSTIECKRQALLQYHLDITDGKNSFLRQPFHKVVCISFVSANIELHNGYEVYNISAIRTGGNVESSESEIVDGFFNFLSKKTARLVSFNGRTFDIPVLKYRALKYGIPISWFFKSGDKWNNYGNRYSLDWHCDLLEAFSDFGASARIKLKEICALLNIPCKYDIDGSNVQDLYDIGQMKSIRDYCEIDAIIAYILYIKYASHSGRMSNEGYIATVKDLISYLECHRSQHDHFGTFLDNWQNKN